jgi:cyclophilin family peptidyl-prolyl cis-trans isomerase/HEAT repeat protein
MMRTAIAATLVILCVAAASAHGRHSPRPIATPSTQQEIAAAEARHAILAAEDSRLVLPDGLHTPSIDTFRAKQAEDLRILLQLARSRDSSTATLAIRALGRFERRDLIPELRQYIPTFTDEASFAVAQAFRGEPIPGDTDQIDSALDLLIRSGQIPARPEDRPGPVGAVSIAVGRLPYVRADQVRTAETYLRSMMHAADSDPLMRPALPSVARGVEALTRRQIRLATINDDTIDALRGIVINRRHEYPPQARVTAMIALIASRGLDAETLRVAANASSTTADSVLLQLRRLAAAALAGAGAPVVATERTELLTSLVADRATIVRIEAVRAWGRQEVRVNGCQRIFDALKDPSTPVALAAIDVLAEQCGSDVNAVDRMTAEARTPPENEWHVASHALLALARIGPRRVFIPLLGSHIQHQTWQVRMYAARAAAMTDGVSALERLALDRNDNVREATLAAIRRLKGNEAEPYFIAALKEPEYELLRTAAIELKGFTPTPQLTGALMDALLRVTAEKKETSRDTRLALMERLRELGDSNQAGALVPLLRDYDIQIAQLAAGLIQQWTGKPQEVDPQLLARPAPSTAETRPARVKLRSGKIFTITLRGDVAPLTVARFARLASAGYYNGLTFHRVVPNFVVQGGSPDANEYSGDGPYMRDEISNASNLRGTVGLSTRGRDTGDAQFFVNLVDNPRLDFEYTVFGTAAPLDVIDEILEGDTIASITFEKDDEQEKKDLPVVSYAGAEQWQRRIDSGRSPLTRHPTGCCAVPTSSPFRQRSSICCCTSSRGNRRSSRRTSSSRPSGQTSRSLITR